MENHPGRCAMRRRRPDRFTAYNEVVKPYAAPVNRISSPEDDHASPLMTPDQNSVRVILLPFASTVAREPGPPLPSGSSNKAIRSPLGEMRGSPIAPVIWYKMLPMGNSSC